MKWPFLHRFAQMRYRLIHISFLQMSSADVILCVGIVRRNSESSLKFVHRFTHSACLEKRLAEIVMIFALVRPQLERFSKIANRFIDSAARRPKRTETDVTPPP